MLSTLLTDRKPLYPQSEECILLTIKITHFKRHLLSGSKANKGIDTTQSPKPKVDRVREPKKMTKITKKISETSIYKDSPLSKTLKFYCIIMTFMALC